MWHSDCTLECFGQQIEISAAHSPLGGPIILHLAGARANSSATMKSGVGAAASNRYRRPTCVPSDIPPPDNHYIWAWRHSVCQHKHTHIRGRWLRRCEGVAGCCWGYISVDKGGRCRVNAVGQPCNWTHRGGWRCPQPRGIFLWPMTALAKKNLPSPFSSFWIGVKMTRLCRAPASAAGCWEFRAFIFVTHSCASERCLITYTLLDTAGKLRPYFATSACHKPRHFCNFFLSTLSKIVFNPRIILDWSRHTQICTFWHMR